MTKFTTLAVASLVAVTMVAPDQGWAQTARQRSGGSSSGSSGGQRGGSGGGAPSGTARQAPQGGPQGGPRTSGAQPRGGPSAGAPGSSAPRVGSGSTPPGSGPSSISGAQSRAGTTSYRGQAQPRPPYGSPGYRPGYGYGHGYPGHYYSSYYPYYYAPYYSPYYSGWNVGFSFGFSTYWPYGYASLGWGYPYGYGYGAGYYPFTYAPYGPYYNPFFPYGYVSGAYAGESSSRAEANDDHPTGAVRFRVEPRQAKIYVDGALVGTVDDFDGLTNHLDIETGTHQLEIRAEGYETYRTEISVAVGRTTTSRATLKKK